MTLRDIILKDRNPHNIETNELIATNPEVIKPALDKLFTGDWKKGGIPELLDGKTLDRIIEKSKYYKV